MSTCGVGSVSVTLTLQCVGTIDWNEQTGANTDFNVTIYLSSITFAIQRVILNFLFKRTCSTSGYVLFLGSHRKEESCNLYSGH